MANADRSVESMTSLTRPTEADNSVVPLGLDTAATFIRVSNSMRTLFNSVLSKHRLGWAGYELLDVVCRRGPVTYRETALVLSRHRTSVRTTVAGLVESGLIERDRGPGRGDGYLMSATDRGRDIHARCGLALSRITTTLPAELESDQLRTLLSDLERQL